MNAQSATSAKTTWTLDKLRSHRDELAAIAEKYGAYNMHVFGSVARGEASNESDVDMMVSAKPGTSIFDLVGLWLDLQDFLGCDVSLITDDEVPRRERFLRRVHRDAVPL